VSLILDALRKSEAERQRGKAPDLFANPPAATTPHRSVLLLRWPWLAGSILLLGAAIAFWASVHDDPPGATTATPGVGMKDDSGLDEPSEVTSTTAPRAAGQPAVATASAPAVIAPHVGANAAPQPPASTTANAPLPPPPTPTAEPTATAPAASTDAEVESLPPIAVLAASERALLPPLKLSMHVWDSVPEKRFVIIDGQRVREGSTLGNSFIEEIRHDGVVLNINGRRILLPRP
jgi:general secretion pathway protein B